MILSYLIQIILAIVLVLILLYIAYAVFNMENIFNINKWSTIKKEIVVFDGIVDFSSSQWNFNTFNKNSVTYKELIPSINQNGGAEYSYNFWLYIDKSNLDSSVSDVVLLLRGNNIKVPYLNNTNCETVNNGSYILVKNPLIRMKSDGSAIIVEYNTITSPDSYREYGSNDINCSSGSWYDKNRGLLGIYNLDNYVYDKKWFMFTLVLQEIVPDTDLLFKNSTNCRMYINGINVLDRTVESKYNGSYGSSVMKHNRAPLHVNPGNIFNANDSVGVNPFKVQGNGDSTTSVLMANLNYYNYALTEIDIVDLFNKKFSKQLAVIPIENGDNYVEDKYAIANVSEQNNNLPIPF